MEAGQNLLKCFREKGVTAGTLEILKLDVSSLGSVRTFAEDVKGRYPKIQYLINNGNFLPSSKT